MGRGYVLTNAGVLLRHVGSPRDILLCFALEDVRSLFGFVVTLL